MPTSRIYLSPGMFGFDRVGSYAYFAHWERALAERFRQAGREVSVQVVGAHPTASIRRRARQLLDEIDRTAQEGDPIHLFGHSTGGLDARLVASPTMNVGHVVARPWRERVRSVTTLNTPHFGTPLAGFFATVSGQRALFLVSALTVVALRFGAPPLSLTGGFLAAFGRVDRLFGLEVRLLDRLTERLVEALDDASSRDLRAFLALLRDDQGAMIQLSPEAMDLFVAGVEDNPAVRYQCAVSYAPTQPLRDWARAVASPWGVISGSIFATLQRITALESATYPCAPASGAAEPTLAQAYGAPPPRDANDGVVPLRSQLWGRLVWSGLGDHLDVVGHFRGVEPGSPHRDWMRSGSDFDAARFASLADAVARGMLEAEAA